ncbi:GNAT family N-acetyltransferase [Arcicella rigui]|uniref:GNAT family N-acetyltransferase n=1 Tax=Arcicella rigui TaxID=797020 RepID=A0ABU5Q5Z8_9BACT|nr:GNAT family N-acetyltransferase [Arcicella rigui]MEA5138007.1 GNAT family N-acetyltransferase [Arcicella rigui]
MNVYWYLKHFRDLTTTELYQILQLRNEVFIVEQNCPFQDLDDKDFYSFHFMGFDTDTQKIVAYTRLLPPGISYSEASIGRVVTSPMARGTGIGKVLMQKSIDTLEEMFASANIRIGAQLYLKNFYESFGFQQDSEVYLEDGIEHILMIREV